MLSLYFYSFSCTIKAQLILINIRNNKIKCYKQKHKLNVAKHMWSHRGGKLFKFLTHPTSQCLLINSILNIGNSQNFYSSYSIRHSPWRVDEWIFPALSHIKGIGNVQLILLLIASWFSLSDCKLIIDCDFKPMAYHYPWCSLSKLHNWTGGPQELQIRNLINSISCTTAQNFK